MRRVSKRYAGHEANVPRHVSPPIVIHDRGYKFCALRFAENPFHRRESIAKVREFERGQHSGKWKSPIAWVSLNTRKGAEQASPHFAGKSADRRRNFVDWKFWASQPIARRPSRKRLLHEGEMARKHRKFTIFHGPLLLAKRSFTGFRRSQRND